MFSFIKLLTIAFVYLTLHIIPAIKKKKQPSRLCLGHIKTRQACPVIFVWIIDLTDRMIYILWVIWVSLYSRKQRCVKILKLGSSLYIVVGGFFFFFTPYTAFTSSSTVFIQLSNRVHECQGFIFTLAVIMPASSALFACTAENTPI